MPATLPHSRQMNAQEVKAHISALLLRVEAGEEIVLTCNGRLFALL